MLSRHDWERFGGLHSVILVIIGSNIVVYKSILVKCFLKLLQWGLVCSFYLRTRLLTWIFWCEIIGILGIIIIILSSGWFGRFLGIFSVILVTLDYDIVVYKSILVKCFLKVAPVGTGLFLLPAHQIINLDPCHPWLRHEGIQKYFSSVFLELLH